MLFRFPRATLSPTQPQQSSQSGQVGIIIILIMIVLLTIGLSVSSQSTKEVFLSNQEDESTRVFNAAEAGVEAALATDLTTAVAGTPVAVTVPNSNATVNYTVRTETALDTRIPEGGVAMIKIADPTDPPPASAPVNMISLQWGRETDCGQKPATLIVEVFSYDASKNPKNSVRYYGLTPFSCNYGDSIQIAPPVALPVIPGTGGYFSRNNIPILPTDVQVRIKPFYNDTAVQASGIGGTLPVQTYIIQSTATNQLGSKNETRSVQVNRTLSAAPSILDFVLFSGTTLIK